MYYIMVLVIVESPGKIKKIQSYLGPKYTVMASVGHIQDLHPNSLSVDILEQANSKVFIPKYTVLENKAAVVAKLRKACKEHTEVIIASDEDREGEFIGFSIASLLQLSNPKRIVFNEISKTAIEKAVANPRFLDTHMINSQKTRRILDRIIGYKIRPLLSTGQSAGRVQSVVVMLIIDKERDVKKNLENLKSQYTVNGVFEGIEAKLVHREIADIKQELTYLWGINPYFVEDVIITQSQRNPPAPFITSTLQQEASSVLKMSAQQTMSVAQKLYEEGLITYMRTDSTAIGPDFSSKIEAHILEHFGSNYNHPRIYKNKEFSQEAHECIRPTDVNRKDDNPLYELIWRRTVASQMESAVYDNQKIVISNLDANFKPRQFEANNKQLVFDGFLKVYGHEIEEVSNFITVEKGVPIKLESLKATETFNYSNSRYTEATLIKKMEALGIGRPSTYANIIKTILDRGYVEVKDVEGIIKDTTEWTIKGGKNARVTEKAKKVKIGFEKKKFVPTQNGIDITEFLLKHFSEIMNYNFTAEMEKTLDDIAEGKNQMQVVLNTFYDKFNPIIEGLVSAPKKNKNILGIDTSGNEYSIVAGKYGLTLMKKYTEGENTVQFFPLPKEGLTLEEAIEATKDSRLLGIYRKKPIFEIRGKFGLYLKYGDKNFSLRECGPVEFDIAKKLVWKSG